jgi:leucine dehydrogenase
MSVFTNSSFKNHEQIAFCHDASTGLKAIIAIHDTTLGPALGGTRFWDYQNDDDALRDVLRLSRGMTYKAAVAGLNLGGGKAVIIGNAKKLKSEALFRTFGRFVDSLGGRYITAEDVNIGVADMDYVAAETRFVTGISGGSGDPSPMTAFGVYAGIRAAVKYKLNRETLDGIKVSVQGIGHVGEYLCELLYKDGAKLFVYDIDKDRVQKAVQKFAATAVGEHEIYSAAVDVYAPCALGGALNSDTIPAIKASIVAGAANNQLQDEAKHGAAVKERGILYAPDYVINAGGLINVYHEIKGYNENTARKQTAQIHDTLLKIFSDAEKEGIPTNAASDRLAEKRIENMRQSKALRNSVTDQRWIK